MLALETKKSKVKLREVSDKRETHNTLRH